MCIILYISNHANYLDSIYAPHLPPEAPTPDAQNSIVEMNISNREPTRVLIILRQSSPHWSKCDTEVIDAALQLVSQEETWNQNDYRFMAKEMWGTVTFFILDIFNGGYDWNTAHLEGKNDLPVITVRFSRKKETALVEGPFIRARVNQQLRQLHDDEGYESKPPFYVDHTNGKVPTCLRPRTARSI